MFDIELSKHTNKTCLITQDKHYSYNDIEQICQSIEEKLPKNKSLILIKTTTTYETIIIYLSLLRKNHAFIMDSPDNISTQTLIKTYKPNYIWEQRCPNKEYIVTLDLYGLRKLSLHGIKLYKDLSLMLSTSGSTGSPKLVRLSKKSLYANCHSISKYLKISSNDRTITNLPLHYSYGLSVLNTHLHNGASIVISDLSIMSKEFWDIFKKNSVTTLNGVPYHYEIFKRVGLMKMKLPSLKIMTQAGGKLNTNILNDYVQWSKENGIIFYVMYGQTEATARISYLPPHQLERKISSIGMAIPNGELYLRSVKNQKIKKTSQEGELVYKGVNVMLGYANRLEDLIKGDESKGILHTGDLAYQDEDGYFYITGRLKRFIKIHGNRISLDEIQEYLQSKSFDILCTGVDNKLIVATIESSKEKEIQEKLMKRFKLHHSVLFVHFLPEYPILSSGKIDYQELLKALM